MLISPFYAPFPPPALPRSFYRSSGVKYNRMWYAALALVTLVLFTISVGAMVFMAVYYTHPTACLLNKFFLGINSTLCFFVSLLAISPFIQKCKNRKHLIAVMQIRTLHDRCIENHLTLPQREIHSKRKRLIDTILFNNFSKSVLLSNFVNVIFVSLQYSPHQACCSRVSSVSTSCTWRSQPFQVNRRNVREIRESTKT